MKRVNVVWSSKEKSAVLEERQSGNSQGTLRVDSGYKSIKEYDKEKYKN